MSSAAEVILWTVGEVSIGLRCVKKACGDGVSIMLGRLVHGGVDGFGVRRSTKKSHGQEKTQDQVENLVGLSFKLRNVLLG